MGFEEGLLGLAFLLALAALGYQLLAMWVLRVWQPVLTNTDATFLPHTIQDLPALSLLKPLHGDDGNLYACLRSFCLQDYPRYEMVCGVQDAADPAVAVVQRLQQEFPALPLRWILSDKLLGCNPKVNNLAGILAACNHDLLLISDADIVVGPQYLHHLLTPLVDAQTGVLTCLYRGLPDHHFSSRLLASQINSLFLPSVRVSAHLGPNIFCGGATMALQRSTLEALGGLESLADQLADDYWLGARARQLGKATILSDYVVDTQVHEASFRTFYQHALRWSRTTRSVQPLGHFFSFFSYPLPLVAVLTPWMFWGAGYWGIIPLGMVLLLRLVYHRQIMHKLGATDSLGTALLADFLGLWIWFHALFARRVAWRGSQYAVTADGRLNGHDGVT
ncbi:bacteriohopanetetrol glucosamine biosynthesis glycosyltransferase HpnI [Acidithiobacillus thiooxidans]|uniref:bacteriohopanetetrol glucosamine biosynthesis glycosyltransferase HpnI n=1 Tax=Acidithiobacillus thiooxidans TaxID=930 RepID=UPI002861D41E|nr:bacteriohopanetetrol glucosamine biosynthesis glycosyltransferase HpnI [Acidithiobacillus thiooxidans]MDR7926193.1 bacteriohopanetetrol glucosamine biosynthesis glycosyltransferase HpnI [Acidithiobacillus thiooxidans]